MIPITTCADIAHEEILDAIDPLRHLMAVHLSSNHKDAQGYVLPAQRPPVGDQSMRLEFLAFERNPISVHLAIDASPGCGGVAWAAGMVLAKYLVRMGPQYLLGKNVLELGSGTGLVGLVAGALNAGRVWITDQAPLLNLMGRNVSMNGLDGNVVVEEFNWGDPIPDDIPPPNLVLVADCVYFEPAFPLLVQTLSELTVDVETEVLFCYKKRRKADKRFFAMLKKKFVWTEVMDDPDRETYSRQSISLLKLTRRQPS